MEMKKYSSGLLTGKAPREKPEFHFTNQQHKNAVAETCKQRQDHQTATYFPGSGIWVHSKRSDWKLFRMEWMFAIPMNTTSQFG